MSQTHHQQTARRKFLKTTLAAVAGAGCLSRGYAAAGQSGHAAHPDKPNVHNMLIVGQQTVFLSHLPMFSTPAAISSHRYQAILEATFTKSDSSNPQAVYASDRKSNPQTKIYTLNPQEFVLSDLVATSGNSPLSSFQAKIFQGHLEKPGHKLLLSDVEVNVTKVIHFREFDPNAAALAQLEYILFGKGKELFLAHFITKPPDFDQVLQVSVLDRTLPAEALSKGLRVLFSRSNSIAQRLREKQEAMGEIRGLGGAASAMKVKVKADVEYYFEEGELRVPAEFATTTAEKEAGFP